MSFDIIDYQISDDGASNAVWYDWTTAIWEASYGPYEDYSELILYSNGCRNATNHLDCDTACQDVHQLFNTTDLFMTYTIHNCAAYPVISGLWQRGHLSNDAITVAESYGMKKTPNSNITGLTLIESCVKDFCAREDLATTSCKDDPTTMAWYNGSDSDVILWNQTFNADFDICNGLKAEINSDVGGIGVFISYLMQVGLSFLVWVIFHATGDWLGYVKFLRRGKSASRERADTDADEAGETPALARLDFLGALKDFHITQVFFMMAVQIAALIAIDNAASLDSTSWQQFWNNVGILYDLAFGGCLPLLMIQLLLRQTNDDDYRGWYTLVMTSVSVVLAASTWFKTYIFLQSGRADTLLKFITNTPGPDSCGGLAPTHYCYEADWYFHNVIASEKAIPMLVFCMVVVIVMWIDQFRVFGQKHKGKTWRRLEYEGSSLWQLTYTTIVGRNLRWAPSTALVIVERLIVFLTEVTLLVLTSLLMLDYTKIFADKWGFTLLDRSEWSFGQVVAVTIWLPVLCKWTWNLIETVFGISQRGKDKLEKSSAESSRRNTGFSAFDHKTATVADSEVEMGHSYQEIDQGGHSGSGHHS